MADEFEGYRKADRSINWGKYYNDHNPLEEKEKERKIVSLEELTVYKLADELSDIIWEIVNKWDWFNKKNLGDQLVRSADSIVGNIAEGYGRYFFKEYIVFMYYARGSLLETKVWINKARKRQLLTEEEYNKVKEILEKLPLEINTVIKIVKNESKKWEGGRRY